MRAALRTSRAANVSASPATSGSCGSVDGPWPSTSAAGRAPPPAAARRASRRARSRAPPPASTVTRGAGRARAASYSPGLLRFAASRSVRIERGDGGVGEQRRLVEARARGSARSSGRVPSESCGEQLVDAAARSSRAVGGGERLGEAVGVRAARRRRRRAATRSTWRDERGMQQRRVDAGDEHDLGAVADRAAGRPRCPAAARAPSRASSASSTSGRQRGQRPGRRARTTTTGPVDGARRRARRRGAERRAVPLERRLRRAHPRRRARRRGRSPRCSGRSRGERALERPQRVVARTARSAPPRPPGARRAPRASPRSRSAAASSSG